VISLLIAVGTAMSGAAAAGASGPPAPGPATSATDGCASVTTCYTPRQLQVAYGIRPLLNRGIDGRGETVVLPEQGEQQPAPPAVTDIRQDLAGFDRRFHLPPARLTVTTTLARDASRWLALQEETLDVEMVHAVAPAAAIRVVLLPSSAMTSAPALTKALTGAVRLGISLGDVISLSMGVGEHCFSGAEVARMHAALQAAVRHQVTVVAASGDTGPVGGACPAPFSVPGAVPVVEPLLPAADPLVLAVGGTSLTATHRTGAYIGETGWSQPPENLNVDTLASGGGFSRVFARPAYQAGVPGIGRVRAVPDVAGDASAATGLALVAGDGLGAYAISGSSGTSAAAPFWAGLVAEADQLAGHDLGFVNPALYGIARGPDYHRGFHDVIRGNSTVIVVPDRFSGYRAGPGWDPVTGWGSPDAQLLIPLLARYPGHCPRAATWAQPPWLVCDNGERATDARPDPRRSKGAVA
jgi:subtilase family serine protease